MSGTLVPMGTGQQKKIWVLMGTGYKPENFLVADGYWVPAKFLTMPTPVLELNFEQSFDKNLKARRSKVLPPEIK